MHGWLIIDKPIGIGSTQIVGAVQRALRDGGYPKVKVGHGGTLDPLASGVLPVALGEATKLSGRMLDADKVYDFTIRFGEETDTLDGEGEVVACSETLVDESKVLAVLGQFTGPIAQVPPAFSAIKLGGRRAYDLARAGEKVELSERDVTIHALELLESRIGDGRPHMTLRARVSKGTYIRSLARDIARAAGSVGHVVMLRRTKAGPFTLDQANSLDKLGELAKARQLEQALLPLTAGLDDIPALSVTPDQARALRQGRSVRVASGPGGARTTGSIGEGTAKCVPLP